MNRHATDVLDVSVQHPGATPPSGAHAPETRPAAWPVVAAREIHVRLTDKNFLISTAATLLILIAVLAFQGWMASKGSEHRMVVSTQEAQGLAGRVDATVRATDDKSTVTVTRADNDAAARAAVADGSADVWLHEAGGTWNLTSKNDTPSSGLQNVVGGVVRDAVLDRNAAAAGTTAGALLAGTELRVDQLEGSGTEMIVRMVTGLVLALLFYMVSLLFGMAIAQSVVEEKQSRIVEIIASAVPLRQILAGKVLGNTVLALGQMTLFLVAGLIGLQFTPYKTYVAAVGGPIGWFIAFFLVGFVALACLWAVAGSLASRNEDLQTTSQPMMLLIMIAFFGGFFASGTVQTVLSFVPITSGVTMPIRLLAGDVPLWQPLLALLINLAFAAFAILVGERAYRRSILAGGGRVSWKQALTAKD